MNSHCDGDDQVDGCAGEPRQQLASVGPHERNQAATPGSPTSITIGGIPAGGGAVKRQAIRVHPHGFRHTHAFELMQEGVPLPIIQKKLGHNRGEHAAALTAVGEHVDPVIELLVAPALADQSSQLEVLQPEVDPSVAPPPAAGVDRLRREAAREKRLATERLDRLGESLPALGEGLGAALDRAVVSGRIPSASIAEL
jgi:hypothetical protein